MSIIRLHIFIIVILLSISSHSVHSKHLGKTPDGLDQFTIDLAQEPKDRFKETALFYKKEALGMIGLYSAVIADAIKSMFKFLDIITFSANNENYQEIEGIAETLELSTNEIMMMNYLYELDAYCTSIVARLSNNTVVLARNLDFYFPDETRKILFIAKFYQGDHYLFEAPMFAGITGIYTGHRPGGYSLAINERTSKNSTLTFVANLGMMFSGFTQIGQLARQTLTECSDYTCAVNKLQSQVLIAGGYFIIAGLNNNEGAIITRDRTGVLNITTLSNDNWYIVQTNQDHYNGDCPTRCFNANQRMQSIGLKNITAQYINQTVLNQWPNLNLFSIYTSIFTPSTGYSRTFNIYADNITDPGDII